MFSERRYAHRSDHYEHRPTSVLVWLLCALGTGFVLQMVFQELIPGGKNLPEYAAALSLSAFSSGRVWTILTYTLLHGNPLHLLVNGVTIYFMGREVLPLIGNKRFVWFCLAAAAAGGALWLGISYIYQRQMPLIGASSISLALLILFACFYPNNKITVLLFFIIPVSIRPKYVAYAAAALDLFGLIFIELPGKGGALSVAYSAHIGGMLVAVAYYFLIHKREWRSPDAGASSVLPEWLHKKKKPEVITAPKYKVNITSREDLRAEVDRILDKINSQGFASLSDDEKRILDSAKDMLSGR